MQKFFILLTALLLPVSAVALEVQKQGDIAYVSGGVGEAERDEILGLAQGFNLRLLFATKEGPYLSGTHVEILDSSGTTLLTADADGPFFYAQLPAGSYMVNAGAEPTVQSKKTTIAATGHREIHFRW